MTCVKLLISVALGACQLRSTADVACPWCARDATKAAIKLLLGLERIIVTSWLTTRYINKNTRIGVALGIQKTAQLVNWEVGGGIHASGGFHIFIYAAISPQHHKWEFIQRCNEMEFNCLHSNCTPVI